MVDGAAPVDAYTRASRLSYLLWNTTPDDELLRAAETGALLKPAGLQAQIDRLTASPRLEEGVEAFFDDMLQLELFEHQSKDPTHFPKYSQVLATQAREQTLRTVVDLLVHKNGDYRDIFTSRDTFMTRGLAMVYKTPFASKTDWAPYTFPAGSGRSGVLTQISFLSLFSHPARSSPTKRGVALNEIFLCEITPAPPGDVDFSQVNGDAATVKKTVRLRLEAHATDETCASCHSMVDPPGLALERFDSLGEYREFENGERIDVKAEMDGQTFEGAAGLGMLLRENPRAPACLARNLFASGAGRSATGPDKPIAQALAKTFAEGATEFPTFCESLPRIRHSIRRARPRPRPARRDHEGRGPHDVQPQGVRPMRSQRFNRRSILRGVLGGATVGMGLPLLDLFLDGNGAALANGAPCPLASPASSGALASRPRAGSRKRWVPTTTSHPSSRSLRAASTRRRACSRASPSASTGGRRIHTGPAWPRS